MWVTVGNRSLMYVHEDHGEYSVHSPSCEELLTLSRPTKGTRFV